MLSFPQDLMLQTQGKGQPLAETAWCLLHAGSQSTRVEDRVRNILTDFLPNKRESNSLDQFKRNKDDTYTAKEMPGWREGLTS